MTEDTSPENLRKFLESDDPAMVRMGLSMAKGAELDISVNDLETLLQHENIEIVKIGFEFVIKNKKPLTVTDKRMTRFIMSISEAASMILKVTSISNTGEIYILKMPSIKIEDLGVVTKFAGPYLL